MLVDLEPYGSYSSQLFFDTMSFGIDGGCRIFAPRSSRVTDRYINLGRNPVYYIAGFASVIWQTSFAKADGLIDRRLRFGRAAAARAGARRGRTCSASPCAGPSTGPIYYDTPALATDTALQLDRRPRS